MNKKGFTLIELLIVIGIIAILAAGVIVAINPGRQFAQARDATRESHINTLHSGLLSYQVSNNGNLSGLPITTETTEICNTNLESYDCTDLIDLSILVTDGHINQLPVDPRATGDGTGYEVAEGSIILVAPLAETRFIGRGITQSEYEESLFVCGEDITFTYNGSQVTYGTVNYDGGCWMDRNLGASQVATAYNDSDSYGDLFQWGRLEDGHQIRSSSQTSVLANSDHPGHTDFITNSSSPYDWRDPQNDNMWNEDGSGSNDYETCPEGWRIPSETEWSSASSGWENRADPYSSVLKIPAAGYRYYDDGSIKNTGDYVELWSSSVDGSDAISLFASGVTCGLFSRNRASGYSIRCIKN